MMTTRKLTVVGAGPGREEFLSCKAAEIIRQATKVYCTDRLFHAFSSLNKASVNLPFSESIAALLEGDGGECPVLLASGDVGFYSVSSLIRQKLEGWDITFLNGFSSLQYFCGLLRIPYQNMVTVSVHGRDKSVIPYIAYHPQLFVLTGGSRRAQDVARELAEASMGYIRVTVGENLSADTERIVSGSAAEMQDLMFDSLSVMLLENDRAVDPSAVLRDEDFVRGKTPMTKQEIRDVSLARLDIRPGDVVYDIGAGTGSVSMAMARRAYNSMVYAVERHEEAVSLIRENRIRLGAYNVETIWGKAPEALEGLPAPHKVFIGGSSGNMPAIFEAVLAKNPAAHIVVNAITLETLQQSLSCFKQAGREALVSCISCAQSEMAGGYHMMKAHNPVYIITSK